MKMSGPYQMAPRLVKSRDGWGMLVNLLGVNSDCKGEAEGFSSEELEEDPCTSFLNASA